MRFPARVTAVLLATALLLSGVGATQAGVEPPAHRTKARVATTAATTAATTPYVRIVAAGDIACPPRLPVTTRTCRQQSTASWAARLNPRFVFPLGDTQYDRSTLAEFQGSYADNWGHLLARTRPTIGNHEYLTPDASGYYTYFADRQPGPPGYYSAATVGWTFYYLNSNCDQVDCDAEAQWLDQQMTENPATCTLITMHHPRFSSGGEHGDNTAVIPLWRVALAHRADIMLTGHDHDYERFVRLDADGHTTRAGIQEFVVGTGGRSLYRAGTRKHGSAYFQNRAFGVLALDLRPGTAHWVFRAINGDILDRGDSACI